MKGYLRNKATGEIHSLRRDERCNIDDMAEENKEWLTWEELLEWIQKGGVGPENFCGWDWKTED